MQFFFSFYMRIMHGMDQEEEDCKIKLKEGKKQKKNEGKN